MTILNTTPSSPTRLADFTSILTHTFHDSEVAESFHLLRAYLNHGSQFENQIPRCARFDTITDSAPLRKSANHAAEPSFSSINSIYFQRLSQNRRTPYDCMIPMSLSARPRRDWAAPGTLREYRRQGSIVAAAFEESKAAIIGKSTVPEHFSRIRLALAND